MLLCIVYDMGQQASWWEKMALSKSLKRKVDRKNRAYKEEWKDNYALSYLVLWTQKKPVCLMCNEAIHRRFECLSELFKLKALNLSQNQTLLQKRPRIFILKAKSRRSDCESNCFCRDRFFFRTSRYQNNVAVGTGQILLLAGLFWPTGMWKLLWNLTWPFRLNWIFKKPSNVV